MTDTDLIATLTALDARIHPREAINRPAVRIPAEALSELMPRLRDDPRLAFDMLCTHTAVDRLADGQLELLYMLYSTRHHHTLAVSSLLDRNAPEVVSVASVWRFAEWLEREAYDMFGILYRGHPDLRRLLLPDNWTGFPLRKDYKDDFMLERPK